MNSWIDYWRQDTFWSGSDIWKIHAEHFLREATPFLKLSSHDAVLEIGCGPGLMTHPLARQVAEVCAVDTSERFVQICREQCADLHNVEAKMLGSDYTDLSIFGRQFSLFLCVSVVQYYKEMSEVETLIRSAASVALPGARMLIADLPLRRNGLGRLWDGLGSLWIGFREGYFLELLRSQMARSPGKFLYRSARQAVPELQFSVKELNNLIRRMKLNATVIPQTLSVCANRPSLLIRF